MNEKSSTHSVVSENIQTTIPQRELEILEGFGVNAKEIPKWRGVSRPNSLPDGCINDFFFCEFVLTLYVTQQFLPLF